MNRLLALVRFLRVSTFLLFFAVVAEAEESVDARGLVRQYIENAEAKILKVYSIHDGDHRSQAYVIEWKGQEVVVRDITHSLRRARLGQPIRIEVRTQPYPKGRHPHGLLSFQVVHPKPPVGAAPPPRMDSKERLKIPGNDYGTFTTPVLRVYRASDGPHLFRAYVFDWKGEEAIAFDELVRTDHEVGDMMTVFYSRHLTPGSSEQAHGLLYFSAISEPSPRRGLFRR